MLFEIFNAEGSRTEWTDNENCVLGKEAFQQRLKDGYTIKLNGKTVRSYSILEEQLASQK